jgi:hypothetical protein
MLHTVGVISRLAFKAVGRLKGNPIPFVTQVLYAHPRLCVKLAASLADFAEEQTGPLRGYPSGATTLIEGAEA